MIYSFDSTRRIDDINSTPMYFARIDKKLDVILDLIKNHPRSNYSFSTLDTTFLDSFPIKDIETLKNMDEMFRNDQEYMAKLVINQYNIIYTYLN